jgi:hypothetical protein
VIEVVGGAVGLVAAGIDGLAVGWLAAVTIEAGILAPIAYRGARAGEAA